ncbi:hypothetical protein GGR51DRAFT_514402 [Nemania sp. FL0031]|nr:hypothetical protein GGR51DRAFT_514402 [Nemania sp. FL0031]
MDPLSIIASITGIATAGISLSRALYDAISTLRNAPKEVSQIARGLYELSSTFRELQRVLKEGQDIYRRKLVRRVASAIKRVSRVQREIQGLLHDSGALTTLKWIFRKSKTMELLYTIESHKTGIGVILQTMILAVQLKQLSRENERSSVSNDPGDENVLNEVTLARQQAETTIQISYQPLRELTSQTLRLDPKSSSDNENSDSGHDKNSQNQLVQIRNTRTSDDALWLYELVFSATIEAIDESSKSKPDKALAHHTSKVYESPDDSTTSSSSPNTLISRQNSSLAQIQALAQQLPTASTIVNELLSEWTSLTEAEIEGTNKIKQQEKKPVDEEASDTAYGKVQTINFKDAVGRKFEIPFHLVQEWKGMEDLIKKMFTQVDIIGPHVQAGHYDVIDSKGNIVLPDVWKYLVSPTSTYTMHMWPIDQVQKHPPGPPPPPPPTSLPGLSRPGTGPPPVVNRRPRQEKKEQKDAEKVASRQPT